MNFLNKNKYYCHKLKKLEKNKMVRHSAWHARLCLKLPGLHLPTNRPSAIKLRRIHLPHSFYIQVQYYTTFTYFIENLHEL